MSTNISAYQRELSAALEFMWRPYYIIAAWVLPVAIFVGLVGNLYVVFIIALDSAKIHGSPRVYYLYLAVLDIVSLVVFFFYNNYIADGLSYVSTAAAALLVNNNVDAVLRCKTAIYIGFGAEYAGNWVYVAFTLERLLFVVSPMKARQLISARSSAVCATVATVGCYAFSVSNPIFYVRVTSGTLPGCAYFANAEGNAMAVIVMVMNYLVAPVISIIAASIMLIMLRRANEKRAEMGNSSSSSGLATTITLIIISCIHSVSNAAFGIGKSYWQAYQYSLTTLEYNRVRVAYNITHELLAITHGINFFVYFARIPQFRKAVFCQSDKK